MNNIKYLTGNLSYIDSLVDIWNEEYNDNHYLKPLSKDKFLEKFNSIPFFNWDNTIMAMDNDKVIGYII